MELIVLLITALLLLIVAPILLVAVNSKEKQIRERNERKKKLLAEQERKIQLEKEAARRNEIIANNNQQKKDAIKLNLNKSYNLFNSGIYNHNEYLERKFSIIEEIKNINIDNSEDFILEMIPLKDKGILDKEDLKKIKENLKK